MKKLIPRKFERKRFVGEAFLQAVPGGAPFRVQVLDLAQAGLAMFASGCLPTGQLVELTFRVNQSAARSGLGKRTGRVVRSRSHPDGNVIGVAFIQPLEDDELKELQANWVRS